MSLQLVGVLEDQPRPWAGGECTMTLAVGGELFQVSVSGGHVRWVLSTVSAGLLVQVEGAMAAPGLVHARWVWPVDTPGD